MKAVLKVVTSLIIACIVVSRIAAQTSAGLYIRDYAGLTITGTVGTVYSIEYVSDLAQTDDWRCLEYLRLPASPYLWTDTSAPMSGKRYYRAVTMEAPDNMVFIPPGSFRMGSPEDELDREVWEGPLTSVIISRGYWMGKYEVTQGQYAELMGSNPSWFNGTRDYTVWDDDRYEWVVVSKHYGTNLNRPVEQVSWDDAVAYCVALTERERAPGRIAPNSVYRLPTEAEWEYACRAWTSTRFSYGDDPDYADLTHYAWYYANSGDDPGLYPCGEGINATTLPVGLKLPNPWGLYDMHGNVWEWCHDEWIDRLPGGIAVDPQGPITTGSRLHVKRGGSYRCWSGTAGYCRSASRDFANSPSSIRGFRVVLAPSQP
jgi:formylglycine-generating enzyme required for sulfatase activity